MNNKIKNLTFGGIFIAIYFILTNINPLSWGAIQVRFSEMLLLIPFWNKKYTPYAIVSVMFANLFSPLGLIDVICGGVIAIIAYYIINPVFESSMSKKYSTLAMSIIIYPIIAGLIVGIELSLVYRLPYIASATSVMIGQVICGIPSYFINNKLVPLMDKYWR